MPMVCRWKHEKGRNQIVCTSILAWKIKQKHDNIFKNLNNKVHIVAKVLDVVDLLLYFKVILPITKTKRKQTFPK